MVNFRVALSNGNWINIKGDSATPTDYGFMQFTNENAIVGLVNLEDILYVITEKINE